MAQIEVKNVALGYDGKNVVEKLNFSINRGDYLCIVGENGSGKSTLIKALTGLKRPNAGEIVTGDDFSLSEIGYLPQQTLVQKDFPASVREIVRSGCIARCGLRPFYTKKEKALADECMRKLDIMNLSKRCYRELSGGQQQRVLLARAICATKKMLLLDEPVAGLDPLVTAEMYELIDSLNKEEGITIIMVSHDISSAVKYASKILHLSRQPLFFGTTEEYKKSHIGRFFINGGEDK
jgi:zinc transport system ATP-binding protein